ncbi:MAG: amino acid permease [Desulfobulbus propionicus]|nr:MAG: amino acid permease [Desulfobulbus propionicus]
MSSQKELQRRSLGTFSGVFTPSILTILGIILFLRHGYVVGGAGLGHALLILALANLISLLTSFSLAAIATNLKVKGGGDYYLISRTLGVEFGGALGLVLFLAQSVSIAFYCIGFGEAVQGLLPGDLHLHPGIVAAAAVVLLFLLAWMGADLATRFQFLVMGFLVLALLSFYLGGLQAWDREILHANWQKDLDFQEFWLLFALFFPAATGFTQGVSMSGDLKDPAKSLPWGTFLAVGVSLLIYLSVTLVFAGARPLAELQADSRVMADISRWDWCITAGVIAATLSSALASFLGAPRILQSLARDKVFSLLTVFAKGEGSTDNPRRAVLLAGGIALATIGLGQLDLIARLVSMFFLISYGLLNYATYFEARTASPSFRPRFRWYRPWVSLTGFLACLAVMFAIDPRSGLAAVAILFAIYQYVKRTAGPARWADSQRSRHLQTVRDSLLAAAADPEHPRDWRPYVLALYRHPHRLAPLLEFAALLEGGSGMTTVVRLYTDSERLLLRRREEVSRAFVQDVRQVRQDVFPLMITGDESLPTFATLLQAHGLGPVHTNTLLVDIDDLCLDGAPDGQGLALEHLRVALRLGCHLLLFSCPKGYWHDLAALPEKERRFDVWWNGDATSRLMLLLAHLITRDRQWDESVLRVVATNYSSDSPENRQQLEAELEETRIRCEAVILEGPPLAALPGPDDRGVISLLPLQLDATAGVRVFAAPADDLLFSTGICVLVLAGDVIDLDASPEEGVAGELAQVLDTLERADRRVQHAEKAAQQAAELAERLMEGFSGAGSLMDEQRAEKIKALIQARHEARAARRKVAAEQAKSDAAVHEAEVLGLDVDIVEKQHESRQAEPLLPQESTDDRQLPDS